MNHEDYIRLAMEEADKAIAEGNDPFGVVVVDKNGEVAARDHDRVTVESDPTAHGEINAIRSLCKKIGSRDLSEYVFYCTSEPCVTCLTGCIKARVGQIYYGAETELSASLPIKAAEIAAKSKKYPIVVIGGILASECLAQREGFYSRQK